MGSNGMWYSDHCWNLRIVVCERLPGMCVQVKCDYVLLGFRQSTQFNRYGPPAAGNEAVFFVLKCWNMVQN